MTETSIVHVRSHIGLKNTKWNCEVGKKIYQACNNKRQVIIQQESDQLIYFELENHFLENKGQKIFMQQIKAIDIAEVPEGRQRFKFLAVGFGDCIVRVLSLDPESVLDRISMQALPAVPSSVAMVEVRDQLCLHIGLENGVLQRLMVDSVTAGLSDSR